MQHTTRRTFASLFIPTSTEGIDALKWRVRLVDSQKIYSGEKLIEAVKAVQLKTFAAESRKQLVALAKSDSIQLDEFELTVLIVTGWLLEAESISQELI